LFSLPPPANNVLLHRPKSPSWSFPSTAPVPSLTSLQQHTPLINALHDVFVTASFSPLSYQSAEPSPPPVHAFPASLQSSFTAPSHFASVTHVHTSQQPAPLSNLVCHVLPPSPLTVASHLPFLIPPLPTHTFPTASEPQAPLTLFVQPPAFQQHAPFTTAPREVPPPAPLPSTSPQSYQVPPPLADPFPLAPQSHLSVQSTQAAMQPVPASQQSACLSTAAREKPPVSLATLASHA
jgi:hypothetical protein